MQKLTAVPTRMTHVRYVVLGLTVAAYMITYMDRVVISSAIPTMRRELAFDLVTMSWIVSSFRLGYSLFQIPGGWMGDRIGPRRALAMIVTWWSLFTSATALVWNAASMLTVRFFFGMGEAGAFPIATRSLSRWMLPRERGFAQGITHAGSRLAAAATPILVVGLIQAYGWRSAFVSFGALGIVWAAVWYWYYRDRPADHPGVGPAERELLKSSIAGARADAKPSVPWRMILSSGTLWLLAAMYFCYGYCQAVYIDWLPTYLSEYRKFSLKDMGLYASLPLFAGTLANLLGGTISDYAVHRMGNLKMARRVVAIFGFVLAAAAIVPATLTTDSMACVWYTCVAVFGLEFTIGVSWAVPLDIGGDFAGSVSAVMNTGGNIGATLSSFILGYLVNAYGWNVPFLVAAGVCATAAALFLKIDATRRIKI
jgi:MFS transporter, ACS family, glucarate transporter